MLIQQKSQTRIKLLSEHLVDQIKAGEVIEKPSSLVKELVENSLDANAKNINIHIVDNGLDLIAVEDDGEGMSYDDLPLAFYRHTTSKIDKYQDIYSLESFGFRGEALASISSVSRLTCISSPGGEKNVGGRIIINGGIKESHDHYHGMKSGTSIYVRDIFFNTPVRLKFLKSKNSEKRSLKRIIDSFILSNPSVGFSLRWDQREKVFFPPVREDTIESRAERVFFKRKGDDNQLLSISGSFEKNQISGYFSGTGSSGYSNKFQFLFVNNRLFFDKQLNQLIIRAMAGTWGDGNVGHYCINIFVPPAHLDVNVHPNKTQVKFFNQSLVFSLVGSSIKQALIKQMDKGIFNKGRELPVGARDTSVLPPSAENKREQLYNVSARYSFYQELSSQQTFLLDKSRLLKNYFQQKVKDSFPVPESQLTPLIISEPFRIDSGIIDTHFSLLRDLGFEVARLNDENIIVKTIPSFFDRFQVKIIVGAILFFLMNKRTASLQSVIDYMEDFLDSKRNRLDDEVVIFLLSQETLKNLQNKKIVVKINNDDLKIFYSILESDAKEE